MPARVAQDAVRVDGLQEFRRALNRMEKGAARELNKELKSGVTDVFLPEVRRETPVRDASVERKDPPGRLRSTTKVGTKGAQVVIRNTRPYANVVHWGRERNRSKNGLVYASKVVGVPFIYGAVEGNREKLTRELAESFDRYISGQVKR